MKGLKILFTIGLLFAVGGINSKNANAQVINTKIETIKSSTDEITEEDLDKLISENEITLKDIKKEQISLNKTYKEAITNVLEADNVSIKAADLDKIKELNSLMEKSKEVLEKEVKTSKNIEKKLKDTTEYPDLNVFDEKKKLNSSQKKQIKAIQKINEYMEDIIEILNKK